MSARSVVISMRLPVESGDRLKRMATRHGWTASDASARLVEEGLRRAEFAFIDFRDSAAGRQAYVQGTTLAVWEVMLLVRSYKEKSLRLLDILTGPKQRYRPQSNYAETFPGEIKIARTENASVDFEELKRMLPQAARFLSYRAKR